MKLLDGKIIKQEILEDLKTKINKIDDKLCLTVISVGDNEASKVYIRQKEKMCGNLGIDFKHYNYNGDVTTEEVIEKIIVLNNDSTITGILVQMPVPSHIDAKRIQDSIDHTKDVDGLNYINVGKLIQNDETGLVPCTANGIIDILNFYKIPIEGKRAVVVGRSYLVGRPTSNLLLNKNATVTVCHSKTKNLKSITRTADILIVAVGKPNMIDDTYLKKGVTVIDVGINRIGEQLVGDVNFDKVKDLVSSITPVPGGVGQLTIANLAKNILKAYYLNKRI